MRLKQSQSMIKSIEYIQGISRVLSMLSKLVSHINLTNWSFVAVTKGLLTISHREISFKVVIRETTAAATCSFITQKKFLNNEIASIYFLKIELKLLALMICRQSHWKEEIPPT